MSPADFDALLAEASPELREMLLGLLAASKMATDDANELALQISMRAFRALTKQHLEAKQLAVSAMRLMTWAPYVTAGIKYRGQQRLSATGGGKLSPAQVRRALEQYDHRVRNGQKYGAVKALAAAFNVTAKTMSSIVGGKKSRK